jgi:hypothetical protein
LGDGVGDVFRVLPEGELDDAHDQDQQQRRGEYKLGRNRAALVTSHSATPPTPAPARWRAQPPQCRDSRIVSVLAGFLSVRSWEIVSDRAFLVIGIGIVRVGFFGHGRFVSCRGCLEVVECLAM